MHAIDPMPSAGNSVAPQSLRKTLENHGSGCVLAILLAFRCAAWHGDC
jgi:hypothetical protein